jgi:tetratricopeptide (TPR) repeat protein
LSKGDILFASKRFEEATECYDKAIEANPNNSDAWSNKSSALYALNAIGAAMECIDKATEIDPHNSMAWYRKGNVMAMYGLGSLKLKNRCYKKKENLVQMCHWCGGAASPHTRKGSKPAF